MKNSRMFRILYLLLEHPSITAPELAAKLEVSVRTVYRDIDALAMAGIPVCAIAGRGGGISIMPGYNIQKAMLSEEEQNELLFAVQSMQATGQDLSALSTKLGSVFQKRVTSWIEVDFSHWGQSPADSVKFEALKEAVLKKSILQITYYGSSGLATQREVKPFKLIFKDKNWYMQAFCLKAQDYRLFKVSRIAKLRLSDRHFDEDFSAAPPVDFPAEMQAPASLKFRLSPQAAFRAYEEFDPMDIEPQPDGSTVISARFPLDNWVYSYFLSFGTHIEILEPASVRGELAELAKNIYRHHKS